MSSFWIKNGFYLPILGIIISFLACFMGYRLQKAWVALATYFAGFILVKRIAAHFTSYEGAIIGCAIVFGLILAGLSYHIYLVGIFLIMAAIVIWCSCQLIPNQWIGLFIGVILGFSLGILAVKINRPVTIIVTGIIGAWGIVNFAGKSIQQISVLEKFSHIKEPWMMIIGVILGIAGIYIQFKSTHPKGTV